MNKGNFFLDVNAFYFPSQNLIGTGCLSNVADFIKENDYRKVLIVTDQVLTKIGTVAKLEKVLNDNKIDFVKFDKVSPNPTEDNVAEGLDILKNNNCDCLISLGGGSSHDCSKLIGLLATNPGKIDDYVGVNLTKNPSLPLIAINTTSGTAAEMTKAAVVTDTKINLKKILLDKNMSPLLSVNDVDLLVSMPANVTAATGMDALTHAVECYVSLWATPLTDGLAIKAVELIGQNLKDAVDDGNNLKARENMAYAQFMAGMAFNNGGLGYVHSMAHQLGGFYDLPHGVCNAILLPNVEEYNSTKSEVQKRLKDVAVALGVTEARTVNDDDGSKLCIKKIRELSKSINIPAGLETLGVKRSDFSAMADFALKDLSSPCNPIQGTKEDIIKIYEASM